MFIYVNIEEVRNCFPNQHKLLSILSEWDIGDEFNGLIKYFSERAKIEEEILFRKIIKCLQYTVDEDNWDKVKELMWEDVKKSQY